MSIIENLHAEIYEAETYHLTEIFASAPLKSALLKMTKRSNRKELSFLHFGR